MSGEAVRVLLVSARFPPEVDAEALQVAKVLEALAAHREVVVDAVTTRADRALQTRAEHAPGVRQLVAVDGRLNRWQRAAVRLASPWLLNRPDAFFGFAWNWQSAARRLIEPPQVVYSRAFPLSSTFMGQALARHFKVPWLLHLSDPWCECALNSYRHSSWHREQESRCLHAAQLIAFTSKTTLTRYAQRYPALADRMTLHPNVYPKAHVRRAPWERASKLRIVHTGSLTAGRSAAPLFRALARFPVQHPIFEKLEMVLAGPVDATNAALFGPALPWLKYVGVVPPERAAELQREADVLLVVDHHFDRPEDAQHLLSKLTDYLPHRRRVLALSNPQGENGVFIRSHALGDCVAHDDVSGLHTALERIWAAWLASKGCFFERPEPDPAYCADTVAAVLAADFQRLGSKPYETAGGYR
jgi:hypothetical protein